MHHKIEFNQNEIRVIQYKLYTVAKSDFVPDNVTIQIKKGNDLIVDNDLVLTDGNKISYIINTDITKNPGTYYIRWKIDKGNQVFYKMTILTVRSIPW